MNPISLIPAPYRLLAQAVAVLLVALALYAIGRSHGSDAVQRQWDAERLVQIQAAHAAEVAARTKEQQLINKLNEAKNAAIEREKKLAEDAAAATAAAGSLRNTLAAIRRELPAATAAAGAETADTALDLFERCTDEYRAVAAAADGHASDVITLREAWPK